MAAAEQPPKKRKIYASSPPDSSPSSFPRTPHALSQQNFLQPPPQPPPQPPQVIRQPPSLSREVIAQKQRNREEVRKVHDYYKRIKYCIESKDCRLQPELEQGYLSLITASRGCASAQRIAAEFIPKFAKHCPTALEAAAQVVINIHNSRLAIIKKGEDADSVAFVTAKSCIIGLAGICCTAALVAPTSSVLRGICSAVFLNMLTFFMFSFEGKDIYNVLDERILKMQDSEELFLELSENISNGPESSLYKLSKISVLSFLRIFFCCPKNTLGACFEFFKSTEIEEVHKGHYFLSQVIGRFGVSEVVSPDTKLSNGPELSKASGETDAAACKVSGEKLKSDGYPASCNMSSIAENNLLGLALEKDPSLKSWIFSKYKKIVKLASSQAMSKISSDLGKHFGSFPELMGGEDIHVDSDEDDCDSSKYFDKQYLVHRISTLHESSVEISGKISALTVNNRLRDEASGQCLKSHGLMFPSDSENKSFFHDKGGSRPGDFEDMNSVGDISHSRSSAPRDLMNSNFSSPVSKKPSEFQAGSDKNHHVRIEEDFGFPTLKSATRRAKNAMPSARHDVMTSYPSSCQYSWHSDGDTGAMDVFRASKHLLLGFPTSEVSEAYVKFQVERFGPIELFAYLPVKRFASIEYKNIMDAVKARDHIGRHFQWHVKFVDSVLGTRGAENGGAVGHGTHVYIENVPTQLAKDEILHESMKVIYRAPLVVTELNVESALLMEFETPEESTAVIEHLRQHRMEKINSLARSHLNGSRSAPALAPAPRDRDIRNSRLESTPNNIIGIPRAQTGSPADGYKMRISNLTSLISSLSAKNNVTHYSTYADNYIPGGYHAVSAREDDRAQTSTLLFSFPDSGSPLLSDDDLTAVCNLAIGNTGSVVRLERADVQRLCGWLVEFSSVDTAVTALKNLHACPGIFFRVEFSKPASQYGTYSAVKPESGTQFLVSHKIIPENYATVHGGHTFRPHWIASGAPDMPECGVRKADGYDSNTMVDPSQGAQIVSGSTADEQVWMHKKVEFEPHSLSGSISYMPTEMQGCNIASSQQNQAPPCIRPLYPSLNYLWDPRGTTHHMSLVPMSQGVVPNHLRVTTITAPFLPPSVTPLAQVHGNLIQHIDHMFPAPIAPPPLQAEMPLPLPQSPPPMPQSQPPPPPLPPASPPPPPPPTQSSDSEHLGQQMERHWQGALCKSGVQYCIINAYRMGSDICKYSNVISEPVEWPVKLDMTKRTDLRHVKSNFSFSPPHKREVCLLLPSSAGDHKGFQDFISYLKQRECAGVIKIPAVKSIWARLLFILPHSLETCTMLSIAPTSSTCMIALVLPKETNSG